MTTDVIYLVQRDSDGLFLGRCTSYSEQWTADWTKARRFNRLGDATLSLREKKRMQPGVTYIYRRVKLSLEPWL